MQNELEMIQTIFEYHNFGLIAFPVEPFSTNIHKSIEGRLIFHKASQGLTMEEDEIYKWFGEKKLDNCGLILGKLGNLSVLEFHSEKNIEILRNKTIKSNQNISNVIFINFLENLLESTTTVITPEKKIQFWFRFSKNLPDFDWENSAKTQILEGVNIYSDGYIVAPPSSVRNEKYFDHYDLIVGKPPITFPEEIDFFKQNILPEQS